MKNWVEAVHFLRSEGFKDISISEVLDEIRGIGMHHTHSVSAAVFEYIQKVVISVDKNINTPLNLYVRPSENSLRSVQKIIFSLLEEKKIINIDNSNFEKIYTDNPVKLKAILGEDFVKAFHLEISKDLKESNCRISFGYKVFEDGRNYLLAHEHEVLTDKEISFYKKLSCKLMIVASLESSIGSRVKLSIETKLPLLCEIFEETNFLDKYYYSDQLLIELKEKSGALNYREAI